MLQFLLVWQPSPSLSPGSCAGGSGDARPLPTPGLPGVPTAAALWRRPRSAGEGCGRLAAAEGWHARILITTSTGACQGPAAPANHRVRGAGGEEALGPGPRRGGRGGSPSGGSSWGKKEAGPARPWAPPAPPRLFLPRVPAGLVAPRALAALGACRLPARDAQSRAPPPGAGAAARGVIAQPQKAPQKWYAPVPQKALADDPRNSLLFRGGRRNC